MSLHRIEPSPIVQPVRIGNAVVVETSKIRGKTYRAEAATMAEASARVAADVKEDLAEVTRWRDTNNETIQALADLLGQLESQSRQQ